MKNAVPCVNDACGHEIAETWRSLCEAWANPAAHAVLVDLGIVLGTALLVGVLIALVRSRP